ncbi:MAG: helix-turn-helix transcriptional regulator, partial [Holdemanella sp.]|nr:helix-turn-helix transcriptional regulator [Holdemanella sp.]
MDKLYENIKNFRIKMGMSQAQLADAAGYTDRSSIAKIEKGKVDLTQSKIEQFASVFHISQAQLMGYETMDEFNVHSIPMIGEIAARL